MAEYPLYRGDEALGSLIALSDGLRLNLRASCPAAGGIWRAWAVYPGGELPIGVMEPWENEMTAEKTVNLSALGGFDPVDITHGVATLGSQPATAPRGWNRVSDPCGLFADPVLRRGLRRDSELWFRREASGIQVAVPWQRGREFPLPQIFPLCSVMELGGRRFAVFKCGENGVPRI